VVATVGFSLISLGVVLVVLPGPFTLPLVILGAGVLGSEFMWAKTLMKKGTAVTSSISKRLGPVGVIALCVAGVSISVSALWFFAM
jgi:drug/metabolite transporter (DMT)-like permease